MPRKVAKKSPNTSRSKGVKASGAKPAPKKAPKKRQPQGHKLPEHFPEDTILTDTAKKQWKLGKSIGVGGFGEIYLASNDISRPVTMEEDFVVKIEPHTNGPLFVELHFYHRAGRPDMIQKWKTAKKMKHLGMPSLIAFGNHETPKDKYRFLVLDRLSSDLQKTFESCNKKFSLKTAYTVGLQMLDVLEYLHEHDYVHADIKAGNILLGRATSNSTGDRVYLVDFGLALRYIPDGKHKPYEEDPSKAHDGTIEFTSRDAHMGARPSRRGDIEILGYCILQWLCSKLPWEDNLLNKEYVKNEKIKYMSNVSSLMSKCFPKGKCPGSLLKYFEHVNELKYTDKPDYAYLRKILRAEMKKEGYADDGKLDFKPATSPKRSAATRKLKSPRVASPAAAMKKTPAQAKKSRKRTSAEFDEEEDYTPPAKKKATKTAAASPAVRGLKKKDIVYSSPSDDDDDPPPAKKKMIKTAAARSPVRRLKKKDIVYSSPSSSDDDDNDVARLSPIKKTGRPKPTKAAANGVKSPRTSNSVVRSSQQKSTPVGRGRPRKRKSDSNEESPYTSPKRKFNRTPIAESTLLEDSEKQKSPAKHGKAKGKDTMRVTRSKKKKPSATISTQTSPGFYKR